MSLSSRAGWRAVAVASSLLCAAACSERARLATKPVDDPIAAALRVVERYPRHYPAYADLAVAYLNKARSTLDPQWVARARDAGQRSLAIQANFEAFKALAAIEGFAHRFEASLAWAELARQALPEDDEVTCRRVEALLGLGRGQEARRLLPADAVQANSFYTLAAFAMVARADGDSSGAASAFERAAAIAVQQQSPRLAVWAHNMTAALWLQRGDTQRAAPPLAAAVAIAPDDPFVQLHRAELLNATGRPREALSVFRDTLRRHPDAEGFRHAMVVAAATGDAEGARGDRDAAERMLSPAVTAGEVYTLGELARLYRDAGERLDRAEELARQNLLYVRDDEAVATLASIRALRNGTAARTSP